MASISEKCDRENAILTALEAFYGGNAENEISLNFILKKMFFSTPPP